MMAMWRYLLAVFLLLFAAAPCYSDAEYDAMIAGMRMARASCAVTTAHRTVTNSNPQLIHNYDLTIKSWSGGCVNGKRDGLGRFAEEQVLDYPKQTGTFSHYTWNYTEEGMMVGGSQIGLWCVSDFFTTVNGKIIERPGRTCSLMNGAEMTDTYLKQPDGRWKIFDGQSSAMDAGALAAGTLEAESERLISAARAGKPAAQIELTLQAPELTDLLRGGRITQAYSKRPLGLADKRVAIILSTNTIGEIARYRKQYMSLADSNSRSNDDSRKKALASANPDALLTAVAAGVRSKSAKVFPADDLSVLTDGKADYALIVDWRFDGKVDFTKGQFASVPVCGTEQYVANKCPALFRQKFVGYLVSSDLKAIRRVNHTGSLNDILKHTMARDAFDDTEDRYYGKYFLQLGFFFESNWGPGGRVSSGIGTDLSD